MSSNTEANNNIDQQIADLSLNFMDMTINCNKRESIHMINGVHYNSNDFYKKFNEITAKNQINKNQIKLKNAEENQIKLKKNIINNNNST